MACYNVSAEITMYALIELQIDATNSKVAEQAVRAELLRYQPSIPDGGVYDIEINELTVTKENK